MNIDAFATELHSRLSREKPLSTAFRNEAEFEREHVAKPAWELSRDHPEIRVYTHPWGQKTRCANCTSGGVWVEGCPHCWKSSKQWATVEVFGTSNTFDLVARDQAGRSLALEVKWLTLGGRNPNGEFQRFIGQCVIATAVHRRVIGVCCFRGAGKHPFNAHDDKLRATLRHIGVSLVRLVAAHA
jgi:hypothetical protein